MNAPIIHPGDIGEGPVRPSSSQAGVAASHPAPGIKVGDRRVWLSGHEIEVTRLVTSGQFAGEWEYRYVETGAPGIHSAIDLLSMTTPAPTNPSDGAVTQPNPAPSDAPSLVELDLREAADRLAEAAADVLKAVEADGGYGPDSPAYRLAMALDGYRAAVTR